LLPAWLLREPLRLKVQAERPWYEGPLVLLVGPQRLETSGWHGLQPGQGAVRPSEPPVMRDYFIARSEQAGLLWIFRERLPRQQAGGWFLHGLFA
jgi:protein ImuB